MDFARKIELASAYIKNISRADDKPVDVVLSHLATLVKHIEDEIALLQARRAEKADAKAKADAEQAALDAEAGLNPPKPETIVVADAANDDELAVKQDLGN